MERIRALFGYQSQEVPVPRLHEHPLIPFTRFVPSRCERCTPDSTPTITNYIYGGYRCNELGCEDAVFHSHCAEALPTIKHLYHPQHSLNLKRAGDDSLFCTICANNFEIGYGCSKCRFKLDMKCAGREALHVLPANSYGHQHPLHFSRESLSATPQQWIKCKECDSQISEEVRGIGDFELIDDPTYCYYRCQQCEYFIHVRCVHFVQEVYPTSHPQHRLFYGLPDYADKNCLLCAKKLDASDRRPCHCDVCNFCICLKCVRNPPPVVVESQTTHEHQLHLIPRLISFTCNACGKLGDRSPYFCLQCNFMVHRKCIDLPRVININRHHHRVSYTRPLGRHEDWKCKVCRKKVDGLYGAYTCSKCPSFAAHALCATSKKIWDMVELEGTPEEEEIAPFEVIDSTTIKHFSHDHNLRFNKDGMILPENTLCEACVFQICSKPFYSCEQCQFILHEKCAQLPRKKRHVCHSQPFTLVTNSRHVKERCWLCSQWFTGFRYEGKDFTLDVRCSSMTDSLVHKSHPHPLYYSIVYRADCSECRGRVSRDSQEVFSCDECEFRLDYKCVVLPQKVTRHRYDDHPLSLSIGDSNAAGKYWCEACESEVNSMSWFYTCHDCGVVLHISCVVGDLSYIMPGTNLWLTSDDEVDSITSSMEEVTEVLSNTSVSRPLCSECKSRCKLPNILKVLEDEGVVYFCSFGCYNNSSYNLFCNFE